VTVPLHILLKVVVGIMRQRARRHCCRALGGLTVPFADKRMDGLGHFTLATYCKDCDYSRTHYLCFCCILHAITLCVSLNK